MSKASSFDDPSWEDHGRLTIEKLASMGSTLSLPWCPNFAGTVQPGDTFHSNRARSGNPWSAISPFTAESLLYIPLEYRRTEGGSASYKFIETNSAVDTAEHLGVTFGISIGNPFLGASVTGGYDKDVIDNKHASKMSLRASYRSGGVYMAAKPSLNREAIWCLRRCGLSAFKETYGDYYVAGFRIGGDAGLMVSKSTFSSRIIERLSARAEASALLIKVGKTWEKFFHHAAAGAAYSLSAFDTLTAVHVQAHVEMADLEGASAVIANATQQAINLPFRIEQGMESVGFSDTTGTISQQKVYRVLADSNLIVELLLLPITTIREVFEGHLSNTFIENATEDF
ncbi:hypothetical protein TWF718_009214 [Orbilia javanica]|uniref:Uncharacterized protein n=1 Tax=Orbilia javanica TaxID=47235 RepID=A0AAN8MLV4_9PEZI